MAGPQTRKGRDPELHIIHQGIPAANGYAGQAGELTFVANADGAIIQLRAHNGITVGGFAMPLAPGAALFAEMTRVVMPPVELTVLASTSFTLNHGLGYIPDVQLLDEFGSVIPVAGLTITHDDAENTTFNNSSLLDATFTVVLG